MVAWAIGMLPSTLMSLGEASGSQTPAEPGLAIVLMLAAAMGLVAGPLLAAFQWLRLRTVIAQRTLLWLAANAAAWALGMPLIFLGAQANELGAGPVLTGVAVAASIFVAGAVVGAVHGAVLVWLVRNHTSHGRPSVATQLRG
jgi:hypothetical protein